MKVLCWRTLLLHIFEHWKSPDYLFRNCYYGLWVISVVHFSQTLPELCVWCLAFFAVVAYFSAGTEMSSSSETLNMLLGLPSATKLV